MGWCSGTVIFDTLCDALLSKKAINRQKTIEEMISALKDMDWDCESDSNYYYHPLVKKAFTNLGYDIYEDEEYIDISEVCIVMTGFRDRDLQEAIEKAGGRVVSSISGKTTHLLIAGKSAQEGSTKFEKAKDLGIKIMTPAEFKREYDIEE